MPEHGNHQPKDRNESSEADGGKRRPKAKSWGRIPKDLQEIIERNWNARPDAEGSISRFGENSKSAEWYSMIRM
jgi:hypothetical protein